MIRPGDLVDFKFENVKFFNQRVIGVEKFKPKSSFINPFILVYADPNYNRSTLVRNDLKSNYDWIDNVDNSKSLWVFPYSRVELSRTGADKPVPARFVCPVCRLKE